MPPGFSIGASYAVAFAPDGATLLVVRGAGLARYDVATGRRVRSSRSPVFGSVDFAPDGRTVLAADRSARAMLLDPETLRVTRWYGSELKLSPGARFGPAGAQYAHPGWRGDLIVRDVETGDVVFHERHGDHMILALCASPNRQTFAFTSGDTVCLRRWPFEAHAAEAVTRAHNAWALALDDAGWLAIRESDRLSVWRGGECFAAVKAETGGSGCAVAWTPDGALVATGDDSAAEYSAALDERWRVSTRYACAVAAWSDLVAVGAWEDGAVLRRGH